jgi:hypothetical protein
LDSSHFAEVFGVQLPEWHDALRLALASDIPPANDPAGTI